MIETKFHIFDCYKRDEIYLIKNYKIYQLTQLIYKRKHKVRILTFNFTYFLIEFRSKCFIEIITVAKVKKRNVVTTGNKGRTT